MPGETIFRTLYNKVVCREGGHITELGCGTTKCPFHHTYVHACRSFLNGVFVFLCLVGYIGMVRTAGFWKN